MHNYICKRLNATLTKNYGDVNPGINSSNFTFTGLANGETNAVVTANASFGTVDQTTGVGSYNVGATFAATNYNITNSPITTLAIAKRDITAAWTSALSRIYGDANPSINSANFTFSGLVNGDLGGVITPTANFGILGLTSNVGTYTNAVSASFLAANYNITNTPTTHLGITKRDITASVNNANRAYGDANPVWDWSQVTWGNLANSESGAVLDTLTVSAPTALATSNAGSTHAINLTGFNDNNYNLTTNTAGTLTINKRDITAGWTGALSRIYGDVNPVVTFANFSFAGLVNGDLATVISPTANFEALSTSSDVGTYVNAIGANFSAANYNVINTPTTNLIITKRDITASVNNSSRAYGDANPSWDWNQVTWSNLANSDTGAVLDALTVNAPTATTTSNAGTTHIMNLTGFSDNNYNLLSDTSGMLSIDPAQLTLQVTNLQRTAQTANPELTYSLLGLKNSEPSSLVSGIILNTAATQSSLPGRYSIIATGGTALNYIITMYLDGELVISNANNLPTTYEAAISNNVVPSILTTNLSTNFTPQKENAVGNIVIIPDEHAAMTSSPIDALIAITETIRSLFSIQPSTTL